MQMTSSSVSPQRYCKFCLPDPTLGTEQQLMRKIGLRLARFCGSVGRSVSFGVDTESGPPSYCARGAKTEWNITVNATLSAVQYVC
jgi:hypothetical protein